MRIAIVGTGISGLVVARLLHEEHELTLFEAGSHIGGHTNTVTVQEGDRELPVDTGFICFNDWTYPHFIRLLRHLGVASQPTRMHFSVRHEARGLEYSVAGLNGVFAQRRNLLRPRHYALLQAILAFGGRARRYLESDGRSTLGEWLADEGFDDDVIELFVIPMGAAIWSARRERLLEFPARTYLQFFQNHGMLNIYEQPTWRVISGGSRSYIGPLTAPFADRIRLSAPVHRVRRDAGGVTVSTEAGDERFDEIVFACHSDQTLRLLEDPTDDEARVLGAIEYQPNEAVLHTDRSLMPASRNAWASWNYHVLPDDGPVPVTYAMNLLQSLRAREEYLVTLNRTDHIDPARVIRKIEYHHPIFTTQAVAAQGDYDLIGGKNRSHFCGAYWFYGFHEDGVRSALRVGKSFGKWLS